MECSRELFSQLGEFAESNVLPSRMPAANAG